MLSASPPVSPSPFCASLSLRSPASHTALPSSPTPRSVTPTVQPSAAPNEATNLENSAVGARRITKAVNSIHYPTDLSRDLYKSLWSSKGKVFEPDNQAERIIRLYRGRGRIGSLSEQTALQDRLSLIFIAHEVDVLSQKHFGKLSNGERKISRARKLVASWLDVTPKKVKADCRTGSTYLRLMKDCGPGSVLDMEQKSKSMYVSPNQYRNQLLTIGRWEKLTTSEIDDVMPLLQDKFSGDTQHSMERDVVVSKLVIEGLQCYGWTTQELKHSQTTLMDIVRPFIALEDTSEISGAGPSIEPRYTSGRPEKRRKQWHAGEAQVGVNLDGSLDFRLPSYKEPELTHLNTEQMDSITTHVDVWYDLMSGPRLPTSLDELNFPVSNTNVDVWASLVSGPTNPLSVDELINPAPHFQTIAAVPSLESQDLVQFRHFS